MKTTADAMVEQTQVSEQCNRLDHNTEKLLEGVKSLEARLQSVLRPPSPKEKMGALELVPLASFLRDMNMRIVRAIDGLQDIESRLEL